MCNIQRLSGYLSDALALAQNVNRTYQARRSSLERYQVPSLLCIYASILCIYAYQMRLIFICMCQIVMYICVYIYAHGYVNSLMHCLLCTCVYTYMHMDVSNCPIVPAPSRPYIPLSLSLSLSLMVMCTCMRVWVCGCGCVCARACACARRSSFDRWHAPSYLSLVYMHIHI
jgi:hypothetical protein